MKKVDEIREIAQKCLKCKNPGCVKQCPLGNDIPHILEECVHNNMEQAKTILLQSTYASLICATLCDFERSCYGGCILNHSKSGGVPFYEVEAYLASRITPSDFQKKSNLHPKRIAIIGAGISGITAAILFQMQGHLVTLFDQHDKIGGVLIDSLPDFRFDQRIVEKYETILHHLGITICLNKKLYKDFEMKDLKDYDVILLAMGTQEAKTLFTTNGVDIFDAMDILRKAKRREEMFKNRNVVVIGGGNVAMDVARTLSRNQNKVTIVYRRDLENAPASKKEIEDALFDQVVFQTLRAPVSPVYVDQQLIGLETEITEIVDEKDGIRKQFIKTGKKEVISCDAIVEAIGLNARYEELKKEIPALFDDTGWIKEEAIVELNYPGSKTIVATCGDYCTGASTFAKASAHTIKIVSRLLEMIK